MRAELTTTACAKNENGTRVGPVPLAFARLPDQGSVMLAVKTKRSSASGSLAMSVSQ